MLGRMNPKVARIRSPLSALCTVLRLFTVAIIDTVANTNDAYQASVVCSRRKSIHSDALFSINIAVPGVLY